MRNNCGGNLSNVPDYQAILEHSFIDFLTAGGASEKTRNNYRSDLRHFVGWTMLTIISRGLPNPQTHVDFVNLLTPELLASYKLYLMDNQIPVATINRRLSTIRIFSKAAMHFGWTNQNPTASLTNLVGVQKTFNSFDEIILHWKQDLEQQGASKSTIKNYLTDVRKFLEWTELQQR